MSDKDDKADLVEASASAAASALGGAVAGPLGAAVAALGTGLTGLKIREQIRGSLRRRAEVFEHEVFQAIRDGIPADAFDEEQFQDVVSQAFWRAMDTLNPEGVRGLARLAALYQHRTPDSFFRRAGRLLQDLEEDDFGALRTLLTAVDSTGQAEVSISLAEAKHRDQVKVYDRHKKTVLTSIAAPPGADRVLELLRVHRLTHERTRYGTDLALVGNTRLMQDVVQKLLELTGRQPLPSGATR